MKKGIPVNPVVLKWARETAGYQLEELLKKFSKLPQWEEGESLPSYSQLKLLAKLYHRSIPLFFFPSPPKKSV